MLNRVVLPDPFGPITAWRSPSKTSRETPARTWTPEKSLKRLFAFNIAFMLFPPSPAFLRGKEADKAALCIEDYHDENAPHDDHPVTGHAGEPVLEHHVK